MALVILKEPSFDADVALNTVQAHGTFTCTFVAYPQSQIKAWEQEALKAGKVPAEEVLRNVLRGWEPVPMPDGTMLTYSDPTSVDKLLDLQGMSVALIQRYHGALWEERLGNSAPQPAGSSTPSAGTTEPSAPRP